MRKRISTVLLLAVAVVVVLLGRYLHRMAFIGAGYAAQQTCACMFVSGRSLESCRGDLERLAQRVVTLEPRDHEVHARSMLSSATSRYEEGFGCRLAE